MFKEQEAHREIRDFNIEYRIYKNKELALTIDFTAATGIDWQF